METINAARIFRLQNSTSVVGPLPLWEGNPAQNKGIYRSSNYRLIALISILSFVIKHANCRHNHEVLHLGSFRPFCGRWGHSRTDIGLLLDYQEAHDVRKSGNDDCRPWSFQKVFVQASIFIFLPSQGYGAKCGQVLSSGTTEQDIQEILKVHNELRAKLANGLEKRGKPGPQPPAADMEQMVRG